MKLNLFLFLKKAVSHVSAFYVCQPIIFNLFILIILNLVTVSFDFYLAFTAPDEGEFCLTEILGNKIITLLSCPISLAIGFLFFFVDYRPTNPLSLTTNLSHNTVAMGTSFTLNCSAQANPPAKYRFYRGQESLFNTTAGSNFEVYPTSVSERKTLVIYRCIPFNEYGDGPTQTITVTVHCEYNHYTTDCLNATFV